MNKTHIKNAVGLNERRALIGGGQGRPPTMPRDIKGMGFDFPLALMAILIFAAGIACGLALR